MSNNVIAKTLLEVADAIESGEFGDKKRIGVTNIGSEHGVENVAKAVELAQNNSFDVVMIGEPVEGFDVVEATTEEEVASKMEDLLDSGEIDAAVTMHYAFPIGVSTVGRVVTPAKGTEMYIATTTGTTDTNRVAAMVKNTINGIIAAKSAGIEEPTVGILNIESAPQVERALRNLQENGYDFKFAESARADGGVTLRGNDVLMGTPDVLVTDSLTGNILMKLLSSYTTGGAFEALGYGYGPGIGEGYDRKVFIISRASGAPVIANALKYAYDVVSDRDLIDVSKEEYEKAKKAGLDALLDDITAKSEKSSEPVEKVEAPEEEIVDTEINGIDILEIDDATQALWKEGVYAESGMGCTGPIIIVNGEKIAQAKSILEETGYL